MANSFYNFDLIVMNFKDLQFIHWVNIFDLTNLVVAEVQS